MDIRRDTESNVTGNFHLAKTHPYTSSGKDVQCDSHYGEKDFNTHVATTEIAETFANQQYRYLTVKRLSYSQCIYL